MEENGYIVYKHTNKINGKVYIGITHYEDPNRRWCNGRGYKHSTLFNRAIKKYGWDSFMHEVLFTGLSREEAHIMERALIAKYKREGISYNIANGGEGAESIAEETKEKLRQYTPWIKGKHHDEEAREKIRAASKKMWEEKRETMIEAIRRAPKKKRTWVPSTEFRKLQSDRLSKAINCYDLFGHYLATYKSSIEAEKILNVDLSHIAEAVSGRRKVCGGYQWRYTNEVDTSDIPPISKIIVVIHPILGIKEFLKEQDAADWIGCSYTLVHKRLKGKVMNGYNKVVIKYKEDCHE